MSNQLNIIVQDEKLGRQGHIRTVMNSKTLDKDILFDQVKAQMERLELDRAEQKTD